MDQNLTKLHKSTKNLSPIGREKSKNYKAENTSQKVKNLKMINSDSKKNKYVSRFTEENKNTKEKVNTDGNKEKESPVKYPKNINEYRHIMSNFQTVGSELTWILHLRAPNKTNYTNLKDIPDSKANRFYTDTIDAYKKRMDKGKIEEISTKGNSNEFKHLLKHRLGGTGNFSQVTFETTLRNFNSSKYGEWNNTTIYSKPRLFSSYHTENNLESALNSKYGGFKKTLRAFEPKFDVFLFINLIRKLW
jgi:hypothetical protein